MLNFHKMIKVKPSILQMYIYQIYGKSFKVPCFMLGLILTDNATFGDNMP